MIFILSLGWRMAFLMLLCRRRIRAADMCRRQVDCSSESPQETGAKNVSKDIRRLETLLTSLPQCQWLEQVSHALVLSFSPHHLTVVCIMLCTPKFSEICLAVLGSVIFVTLPKTFPLAQLLPMPIHLREFCRNSTPQLRRCAGLHPGLIR